MKILIIVLLITALLFLGVIKCKRPQAKALLSMLAIINLIISILLGNFVYECRYKVSEVDMSSSPDEQYTLFIQQIGTPDFPFGSAHARFVLKQGERTVTKYAFDIADDGKNARSELWDVTWNETNVEVIVRGEEQYDMQYILYFDGKTESIQLETALWDIAVLL